MSDKNLELVKKLLALAGPEGTPEEEARTAAVKAARMIYEHGFIVVEANGKAAAAPSGPSAEQRAAQRAAQTAAVTAVNAKRAQDTYTAQILDIFDRQAPRGSRARPVTSASEIEPVRIMDSRFDGYCRACGKRYAFGDKVAVKAGAGGTHYDCRAYWEGR